MPAVIPRGVTLLIADSSRTGGPEHVLTLAGRLAAVGWEPTVVCPPGSLVERCRERRLAVEALPMGGRALAVVAPRLRRVVRRLRPGVLHTHGLRAGTLALAARPATAAWVHTAHLDGWYVPSAPRRFLHRSLARAVARRADRQIAVSASVAAFLRRQVGVAGTRVVTIPNGVEPLGRCTGAVPAGRRVGLLASLVPSKGVDVALRALADAAGRDLSLTIGGSGPELPRLLDLGAALGVMDRVHLVGTVADRVAFWSACDVGWVPSRSEPFGLVACEAMSAGVPVVGAAVGGLPWILDPPRSGVSVAPDDPAGLAGATAQLLDDPRRWGELAAAGPARVAALFAAERMTAATAAVYAEVVGLGV